jgi:uncharacterized protein (TIGR00661 family)
MKRILITPLDWGFGHATRCIPIIQALLVRNCDVQLAGSGTSLELLKKEFPSLKWYDLPGYDPTYPTSGSMVWKMALQLPKFIRTIYLEHKIISSIVEEQKIDIIISDNRFGCWSLYKPSIMITHQSNILMPKYFGWLQEIVRWVNHWQLKRFSQCWIPDAEESNLTSSLTTLGKLDKSVSVSFVGPLSRFRATHVKTKKYAVTAILSGPEPQRTLFENILLMQLKNSGLVYLVVRGVVTMRKQIAEVEAVDFMTSDELRDVIECSEIVIARSGYSTIMDMQALGKKKVILIPTPGQTEQEYLAEQLLKKRIAFSMPQRTFDLAVALQEVKKFKGFEVSTSEMLLSKAIDNLLQRRE